MKCKDFNMENASKNSISYFDLISSFVSEHKLYLKNIRMLSNLTIASFGAVWVKEKISADSYSKVALPFHKHGEITVAPHLGCLVQEAAEVIKRDIGNFKKPG